MTKKKLQLRWSRELSGTHELSVRVDPLTRRHYGLVHPALGGRRWVWAAFMYHARRDVQSVSGTARSLAEAKRAVETTLRVFEVLP